MRTMENNDCLSPEEKTTIQSYDKIASIRNQTHGDPEFWGDEFRVFHSFLPGGRIIEVGCGSGRDAFLLNKEGYTVVGIDLSEAMLSLAREIVPSAEFVKMDMCMLEFPSEHFDGFWAAASLLHLPKRKICQAIKEIRRVTKTGGVGFIAMKPGEGESMKMDHRWNVPRFFSLYKLEEFRDVLEQQWFGIEKISEKVVEGVTWLCYVVRKR